MSKLKISSNLFLEVNELNKLVKGIEEDGYKPFLKYLCKSFGIAQNSDNSFFKVSKKNDTDNIVTINAGIAFDSDLNRIVLEEDTDIEISNTGVSQWIIISHATTNNEVGTVRISSQGALSGTDTKFTTVLRGQPNFPTKVKFDSQINTGEYEVVSVTSDTVAKLSGSFVAENNLKYQVIGTFTPGFQPDDDDKTIYEYDSCNISVVESEDAPELEENQFILACVSYVQGAMVISDERVRNLFNYESAINDSVNQNVNENPLVALRQTTLRNERILDVQFEWGYKVKYYELITTATQNIFAIRSGESNYISSSKITDGMFKGWLLLNRANMVSVEIDDNTGNSLYISKFDSNILSTDENGDDFVIVPNFKEIEVEVGLKSALPSIRSEDEDDAYGDTQNFFIFSIENARSRFFVPLEYSATLIKLRYRMINATETTKFHNFANTQFINTNNNKETLGDSSFTVTIIKPVSETRNYS